MKPIKILSLIIITGILVLMIPLSLAVHSLNQTVLKPYSWNEMTTEVNMDDILHTLVEEQITGIEFSHSADFEEIYFETIQRAINRVAAPEWIEEKLDELQINIWDYLLEITERIEPLTLHELKEVVIEELRKELAKQNIPEVYSEQVILETISQLPEELDITQVLALNNEDLEMMREAYIYSQRGYDSLIIITLSLFICGLVISFYPKVLLRWSGYLLGVVGLVTVLWISLLRWMPLDRSVDAFIPLSYMGETGSKLLVYIFTESAQAVMQFAPIIMIGGLILIGLSHLPAVKRLEQSLRKIASNNRMVYTVRAVIIVILIAVIGWQSYQLTTPI